MNKIPTKKSGFNPNWQIKTLNEVCNKISAGGDKPDDCTTEKTEENQIPIFSNGIKNKGLCGYTKTPAITKPALTISARGTIGFACVRYEPFFPIVRLICVIPNEKLVILEFLCYALQYIIPQGEGTSVPQLTIPNFKKIKIPIPPLDEQKRIASALSKIDAYLENTIKLIEEKERFKRGIAKKLLTCKEGENIPEARFKGFEDEWEIFKLGDMFDNFKEKNNEDKIILASTIDKGVIPNSLTERKIIRKKESLSNYKLVKKGCFVISLMSFQSGFEYSDYEGIISPAYSVLKPKIEMAHYFYKYYFKSFKFIKDLLPYAEGIRHGKQIKFKACKDILVPYPSIEEQEKIGGYLSLLDKEIDNLKKQKELIKEMKRGAMQKLLSGEVRLLE
ncbi:restriction endonuclease subunit S [Brachyspira aalborgi]|jgi:type I restriction enzyme S subunit|uniref:Restriction endonuclease subunit S n=1 Tax=Brachyspira aalborgi TaxID=29522 RepID=A0ABY3KB34_9SPIR|nr:restriction endonuclease subunit S [Brachyspira aalborgi]TXJ33717.1 restriction endonuclease subunit S [Brachyspira aalborgi]TXJ44988.1 restriction endonuclease subunit S [Brachyspira aalborgi]